MNIWRASEWKPTPCGCGWCNVCGFTGLAPKPKPPPPILPAAAVEVEPIEPQKPMAETPSLFDVPGVN